MNNVFAPGCGLYLYNPQLVDKMLKLLEETFPDLKEHSTCCHHDPNLPTDTRVINICAGCDKRYRTLYEGVSTISFWELLAESNRVIWLICCLARRHMRGCLSRMRGMHS